MDTRAFRAESQDGMDGQVHAGGDALSATPVQLALDLPSGYVAPDDENNQGRSPVSHAKQLGAYYTDEAVAAFLVAWAARSGSEVCSFLDPSCGDGAFLRAACRELRQAGRLESGSVCGVDVDPQAIAKARAALSREVGGESCRLIERDFFDLEDHALHVDAVVGNPPFVRFHRFAGDQRQRALACAARQGIQLSGLSSSWAPFVIHSVSMVRPGGRLAMVLPIELTYAVYATPVLSFLLGAFAEVSIVTFRSPLFADLNEATLLLLARDRGSGPGALTSLDLQEATDLGGVCWDDRGALVGAAVLDAGRLSRGEQRLSAQFLPASAAALWERVSADPRLARLGGLADVGIGYVTGANDFFHLSERETAQWSMPRDFLARAVVRSRALRGLSFTAADWQAGLDSGVTSNLLHVNGALELPRAVTAYLRHGETTGVSAGYKCRHRRPWYAVPQVASPDAFLTYMSHAVPRVVANPCGAVAPNTLHCVHLREGSGLDGAQLALLWCNSLTLLSCELEGHALGGGMLKLEPTEARRVLLPPLPAGWRTSDFQGLFAELNELSRAGRHDEVVDRVDREVLGDGLGLDSGDWAVLREATRLLRARRLRKTG
ncbi:MAG: class I SAM-dependent methyltransferase [Lentisphaerae bacterium]|nr:class I SAM-dependent methyltransferase [Lentisphaerota bacterium]